ncbi:DUF2267 domain-containing protein [Jiella sp. M17.18]|uniref:DUF2267 domain-containing protein n=1 Tax=Jiella sp. M17.18 TaxID=3234247 RepID=UPI0034DF1212
MSDRTIHIFTHHAEEAQHWVNALCEDLDWPSDKRGYHLLRGVLHALRDWLSPEELADFSAQLPVLVRGVLFEGWNPAALPVTDRSREDFFDRVRAECAEDLPDYPDGEVAAVFRLIDRHISAGEARQVRGALRKTLQGLWPTH